MDGYGDLTIVECDDDWNETTNTPIDLWNSTNGGTAGYSTIVYDSNDVTTVANVVDLESTDLDGGTQNGVGDDNLMEQLGRALDNATWTGTEKYVAVIIRGASGSPSNTQTQGGTGDTYPPTLTVQADITVPPTEESGNAPQSSTSAATKLGEIHRDGLSYHDDYGSADQRLYERWDAVPMSDTYFTDELVMFAPGGGYGQNLGSTLNHRDFHMARGDAFVEIEYKLTGLYNSFEFSTETNSAANWPEPIQDWLCCLAHLQNTTEQGAANGVWAMGHSAGSHMSLVGSVIIGDESYYARTFNDSGYRRSTVYNSDMAVDEWGYTEDSPDRIAAKHPLGIVQFAGTTDLDEIWRDNTIGAGMGDPLGGITRDGVHTKVREGIEALGGGRKDSLVGMLTTENTYGDGDYYNGEMDATDIIFGGSENENSVHNREWTLNADGTKRADGRHYPKVPVLHIQAGGEAWWNKAVIGGADNYIANYAAGRGDNVVGTKQFDQLKTLFDASGNTITKASYPIERKDGFGGSWTGTPDLSEPVSHIWYDPTAVDWEGHDDVYYGAKSSSLFDPQFGVYANPTSTSPLTTFMDEVTAPTAEVSVMGQMEPAVSSAGFDGNIEAQPIHLPGNIFSVTQLNSPPSGLLLRGQMVLPTAEISAGTQLTAGALTLVAGEVDPPDPLPPYDGSGPNNPTSPVLPIMPVVC